jgi:hypothetical protein
MYVAAVILLCGEAALSFCCNLRTGDSLADDVVVHDPIHPQHPPDVALVPRMFKPVGPLPWVAQGLVRTLATRAAIKVPFSRANDLGHADPRPD